MTVIQNATGNNFSEILTNVINQVSTQFSEGINGAVNGFRQFSQTGVQGFANNGQQQSTPNPRNPNSPPTSNEIRAGMVASKRQMDAGIPFGQEDLRVLTKDQFGSA